MELPKSFTEVTTFSKIAALVLFGLLPFLGFYLGVTYQRNFCPTPNSDCPEETISSNLDNDSLTIPETDVLCMNVKFHDQIQEEIENGTYGDTLKESQEIMYSKYKCSLDLRDYLQLTLPQEYSVSSEPTYCPYTDTYLFAAATYGGDVSPESTQGIIYEHTLETGVSTEITRTTISTGVIESVVYVPWMLNEEDLIVYNAGRSYGGCTSDEECNAFNEWLRDLCSSEKMGTFIYNRTTGETTRVADKPECKDVLENSLLEL